MNLIQFTSTLKPSGNEYKKIVYWNRFIRTKLETIILLFLFIVGIVLIANGSGKIMFLVIGAIFVIFPIMIIVQFNKSISYHLSNRDKSESMPCQFTIMEGSILTEIKEIQYIKQIRYSDVSKMYNTLGYYMFFNKNDLVLMVNKSDIPDDSKTLAFQYITQGMKSSKKTKENKI